MVADIEPVRSEESISKEPKSSPKSKSSSPVQIFLRVRPLIAEEDGHDVMEYKLVEEKKTGSTSLHLKEPPKQLALNPAFRGAAPPPLQRRQREQWKKFNGFSQILGPETTNEQVFKTSMHPLLSSICSNHQSACVFTYGHTGSGKSHTLLGYDDHGIYQYAANEMFDQLKELNSQIPEDEEHKQRVLCVRITELYKDKVKDLLTGDDTCSIRQNSDGVIQVRGPMVTDEEGRIDQRPLGEVCRTVEDVVAIVEKACSNRRVGTSTHHSQSSRSHLVMEFEVVTPELVEQRNLFAKQENQVTRLKWLQTERMFGKHEGRPMPKWTQKYTTSPMALRREIVEYEKLVKTSRSNVKVLEKDLGGTLVICDLAGNEYGKDAANSTQEELEEASEINKSLLAVKEMIRALNNNAKHVSSRDSKLSMMLKRHLLGDRSRAVMMAHVSPSQEYLRKTINTLTYAAMAKQ